MLDALPRAVGPSLFAKFVGWHGRCLVLARCATYLACARFIGGAFVDVSGRRDRIGARSGPRGRGTRAPRGVRCDVGEGWSVRAEVWAGRPRDARAPAARGTPQTRPTHIGDAPPWASPTSPITVTEISHTHVTIARTRSPCTRSRRSTESRRSRTSSPRTPSS